MAKVTLFNTKGEKVKDVTLKDELWNIEPNDAVLYEAIKLSQNSLRQGTHKAKTRAEVRGGGRKPFRQKGTGNARQGTIRAPHMRGGGVVFAKVPRKYSKDMNRKQRKLALRSALSYKINAKNLLLLDNLNIETPKTKEMLDIVNNLKLKNKILFITNEFNENINLSSRNIAYITLLESTGINVLDIVNNDYIVITEDSIKTIEGVLN
ncbi:MAG: 50S ribosomal protein L4 [Bacilli bacterium]